MMNLFAKSIPRNPVVGHLDDIRQTLFITQKALQHVSRHRQSAPWATEAGGQLFGTINAEQICVTEASGPYAGDERSRHRYRSNPTAAQSAIESRNKRGLLYLGEWHTHAEDYPSASSLDEDAMRRLISGSQLNSNTLLMMIVGRARGTGGLGIWRVSNKNLLEWRLT